MSKLTLTAAYEALMSSGRLTPNPHQAALLARLSLLQTQLLAQPALPSAPSIAASGPSNTPFIKGIYIHGPPGTGKSRLSDLFASTLPPTLPSKRIHFHEFMHSIHHRLHVASSSPTYSGDPLTSIGRDVCEESRVLVFDEFQVTDIADAMILKRLFGGFWGTGGVMVATSNRPPRDLYENGLNRSLFVAFIKELETRCEVWKMQGEKDYRMGNGEEGREGRRPVFYTNDDEFEMALREHLAGRRLQQTTIPVMMSRSLTVNAATSSTDSGSLTVSATFEELCHRFLGSADYYALCKSASTIYMTGLRKFRVDELDYVRRFITLVDLAYESKTTVVCCSAVPLFEIFTNIIRNEKGLLPAQEGMGMRVMGKGGSSSSMMSTFIGEMEWSATGLREASLATGGAGETDVGFAVGRCVSRLFEMGSVKYGIKD